MKLSQQQKDFLKWAKEEGELGPKSLEKWSDTMVEYEEQKMFHNGEVVASFIKHCEENGLNIPESYFESYFGV